VADPLARARASLEGLSVGDAFGERFFVHPELVERLIAERSVPRAPWRFTDDTMMALSIVHVLARHGRIDQDALAAHFAERYEADRGYGPAMHALLARVRDGEPWRDAAGSLFGGAGSFGNGAAMRVAPVGAYFADDPAAAAREGASSAVTTHAHPEAVAGAAAVAAAAALAARARNRDEAPPAAAELIERVLPLVPESEVRATLGEALALGFDASPVEAARTLGSGARVSAQDTVPFALWCAARHLGDFEEAMWQTVSGLGDRDTTCAIAGGIVASYVGVDGIPAAWRQAREPLPSWV